MGLKKSLIWKTLQLLPTFISYPIIRNQVKLDYDLPAGLHFKIAETQDEIIQALEITHDSYVDVKFMDPNSSRTRILKYHFLPTTTILVGKFGDEVVATLSVVRDSPFRLPTDNYQDLSFLRSQGMRLVEISSLAIKKNSRSQRGKLLLPLCKYMWQYVHDYVKADALVMSTNHEMKDLYRAVLLFRPIGNDKVIKFKMCNDDSGISQWLDIRSQERYREMYAHKSKEKNLYRFFVEEKFSQFSFPQRPYYMACDSVLTPEMMEEFLKRKSDIFDTLSSEEKLILRQSWFFDEYKDVIGPIDPCFDSKFLHRRHIRLSVACPSVLSLPVSSELVPVQVDEVSRSGIRVIAPGYAAQKGDMVSLNIELGPGITTKIKARIVYVSQKNGTLGLEITQATAEWNKCIDYLEARIRKGQKQAA